MEHDGVHRPRVYKQDSNCPGVFHGVPGALFHPGVFHPRVAIPSPGQRQFRRKGSSRTCGGARDHEFVRGLIPSGNLIGCHVVRMPQESRRRRRSVGPAHHGRVMVGSPAEVAPACYSLTRTGTPIAAETALSRYWTGTEIANSVRPPGASACGSSLPRWWTKRAVPSRLPLSS